jgi:hypothetical protein
MRRTPHSRAPRACGWPYVMRMRAGAPWKAVSFAGAWELIVNSQTAQWGTDYDASKDLGRTTFTATRMATPEEALSIYLVPNAARPASGYAALDGVMRVKWGSTELSVPWTVKQ